MKLPRVTARQVIKALQKMGFILDRQTGSHKIFTDRAGKWTTVPYHVGKTLHPKTLKSILKDADLTVQQFFDLL